MLASALLLAACSAPALAQEVGPPWPAPDGGGDTSVDGVARPAMRPAREPPPGVRVPTWRELGEAQRRDLSEFAERWDGMPASRRVLILERYERWIRLPPQARARLRAGERNFRHLSPAQRERMRASFRAMRALPPGEQEALRATWRAMSPEQRRDWLERGGPGIAPP